ncbi:MAG: DinB family protein [Jatrophihabitans sp.]|uniref:DinB family protein n=1 Tax=Jatrophihabitans sp. TaxID=1932789 RepID=UPI003F7D791A
MTAPAAPPPDTKDWTWVLGERCADCGYDAATVSLADVPAGIDRVVATFTARLADPDAAARPAPDIWSPVEYACHIRDVCRMFTVRLDRMLTEDDPQFANWDQDATALEERYWTQQPATIAAELQQAAGEVGAAFAAVRPDQTDRRGRRSDGAAFTVDSLGRYFLHDLVHHEWDITARR